MLRRFRSINLLILLVFLLCSCAGNLEQEAKLSLALIERESQLFLSFDELEKVTESEIAAQTPKLLLRLRESNTALIEYFKVLHAFQKTLNKFKDIPDYYSVRSEYLKLDVELRKKWEEKLRPAVRKLLSRQQKVKVHLSPWDYAILPKYLRDISLLKEKENSSYELGLPISEVEMFLALLYEGNTGKKEKSPGVDNFYSAIEFVSDSGLKDTQPECLEKVDQFVDDDCQKFFQDYCKRNESHQLDLACVEKNVKDYAQISCTTFKTDAFVSRENDLTIMSKFKDSPDLGKLREGLRKCISEQPIRF